MQHVEGGAAHSARLLAVGDVVVSVDGAELIPPATFAAAVKLSPDARSYVVGVLRAEANRAAHEDELMEDTRGRVSKATITVMVERGKGKKLGVTFDDNNKVVRIDDTSPANAILLPGDKVSSRRRHPARAAAATAPPKRPPADRR